MELGKADGSDENQNNLENDEKSERGFQLSAM